MRGTEVPIKDVSEASLLTTKANKYRYMPIELPQKRDGIKSYPLHQATLNRRQLWEPLRLHPRKRNKRFPILSLCVAVDPPRMLESIQV